MDWSLPEEKINHLPRSNREDDLMSAADMTPRGHVCGIRLARGPSSTGVILEFYIEDDENYYLKFTVDASWYSDLKRVVDGLQSQVKELFKDHPHIKDI